MYQDRTLTCGNCHQDFTFTAGEQEFHASKGFSNDPGRCPACRASRKSQGGYTSGGYGGGSDRQMHPATCAECGKATEVPFVPSGSRPVYCRDCYSRQSGNSSGNRGNAFSSGRSRSNR